MGIYHKLNGHEVVSCTHQEWIEYNIDRHKSNIHLVKVDMLPGDITLSTVFVGIDMSGGSHHRPLFFETKIFGGSRDEQAYGAPSWKMAEVTHNIILQELKKEYEQSKETPGSDTIGKDLPVL